MENINGLTAIIGNLGFPIFVAVWLLWRSDKIIKAHTKAIVELTAVVRMCLKEK